MLEESIELTDRDELKMHKNVKTN